MSIPLFHSAFPATEFEAFLDEIGIGANLSPEEKEEVAYKAREIVKYNVTGLILQRMDTEEKQEELARLIEETEKSGSDIELNQFFLREIPDWEIMIDEEVQKVRRDLRDGVAKLPQYIEYAESLMASNAPKEEANEPAQSPNSTSQEAQSNVNMEPFPWEVPTMPNTEAQPSPQDSVTTAPHANNDPSSSQAIHDELDALNDSLNSNS
jgi:hypothetical protein